jgi:hypothetical protein
LSVAVPARSTADRYFVLLGDSYRAAAERGGRHPSGRTRDGLTLKLSVGGENIRVAFGSEVLATMLRRPLERLRATGCGDRYPVALYAWDTMSTGVPVPPFPWRPADVLADGRVSGFDGGRFRCLYRDDGAGFHAVSMFDDDARVGYFWFADATRIHWYERAEPLRVGIHWAVADERRFLAHASAVGDARGAVLLTGKGGAGKTTTALSSVTAGLQFVSDNYVLVELADDRGAWAHGLYGTAKLWPQTLERLDGVAPFIERFDVADDEKLVLDVTRYRPDQIVPGLPIRAVVVPEVGGAGATRLERCTPVDTLLALAPATILQLPRTERSLSGMAELVRRVPTYRLILGGEMMDGPAAIDVLLDELGT